MQTKKLGKTGENIALKFLKNKGYKLLCKNYSCQLGEADLVMKDGKIIVFVEVKTRKSNWLAEPEANITHAKMKKMIKVAKYYLMEKGLEETGARLDVVSVICNSYSPSVKHFENITI